MIVNFFEMVYLVMNRLDRLLDLLISLNFSTRKTFFHKSQKCFLGARKLNMWNTNYHSQRHLADHVRFFVRLSWIQHRNLHQNSTMADVRCEGDQWSCIRFYKMLTQSTRLAHENQSSYFSQFDLILVAQKDNVNPVVANVWFMCTTML